MIADLDFSQIDARHRLIDTRGHYSRPELLSMLVDRTPTSHVHESTIYAKTDGLCLTQGENKEERKVVFASESSQTQNAAKAI